MIEEVQRLRESLQRLAEEDRERALEVIARFLAAGEPTRKHMEQLKGLELLQRSAELVQLVERVRERYGREL